MTFGKENVECVRFVEHETGWLHAILNPIGMHTTIVEHEGAVYKGPGIVVGTNLKHPVSTARVDEFCVYLTGEEIVVCLALVPKAKTIKGIGPAATRGADQKGSHEEIDTGHTAEPLIKIGLTTK